MYVMRKTWRDGTTLAEAMAGRCEELGNPTLRELAAAMGTTTTSVERWMKGGVVPSDRVTIRAVADWLETDLSGLGPLIAETLALREPRAPRR